VILMKLKAKYRNKNFRIENQKNLWGTIETKVVNGEQHKSRTNNSTKKSTGKTLRPRRKVYGPF